MKCELINTTGRWGGARQEVKASFRSVLVKQGVRASFRLVPIKKEVGDSIQSLLVKITGVVASF